MVSEVRMDRNCATCKHAEKLFYEWPCSGCVGRDGLPNWQPKEPEPTDYKPIVIAIDWKANAQRLQAENDRLRAAMRKARKVLKQDPEDCLHHVPSVEARQILKEGLKTE